MDDDNIKDDVTGDESEEPDTDTEDLYEEEDISSF